MALNGGDGVFNGVVSLTILEAQNLKSVTLPGGFNLQNTAMDPYCVVDFDDFFFGITTAKTKTPCPVWNEVFEEQVENGVKMQLTVFHKTTIPPDPFVSHCVLSVSDLLNSVEEEFIVIMIIILLFVVV